MEEEKEDLFTQEQPTPVASLSRIGIMLLFGAVLLAGLSTVCHTRLHSVSIAALYLAIGLSFLSLIKMINQVAPIFPLSMSRLIHWIRAMTFESFVLLAVLLLRCTKFSKKEWPKAGRTDGRPILLVHGYCNHGSVWIYLRRQLIKAGLGPIYTIDLCSPFQSIREHAKKVEEKVVKIRQETQKSDIILIGHSMGGLVSALYAMDLAPPDTVTDVITLGSPFGGTHMARLALGENGQEMRRNSPLLLELVQKIKSQKKIRFYHLGTKTDQLVIPSASALPGNDPSREFILEDIGHASLLFSPRVSLKIQEWLKTQVRIGS